MRGVPNYEEKMNKIRAKIEKKQDEIKNLKSQLNELEEKLQGTANKDLMELMKAKGIDANRVMELINQNT